MSPQVVMAPVGVALGGRYGKLLQGICGVKAGEVYRGANRQCAQSPPDPDRSRSMFGRLGCLVFPL